jgi:four helix bundle protein
VSPAHFRELEVWRLAMSMTKLVYGIALEMPPIHRFGLASQMQRSAVSVPSNIAEGNARGSTRDYARFVSMAAGSNAELQTQLLLCKQMGLAADAVTDEALALCDRVGQMLLQLHRALRRKLVPESRVPSPESRS